MIDLQLPDAYHRHIETRCPETTWLSEFYYNQSILIQQGAHTQKRTAVFAGCNKGIDAINTLRMLSNNPSVDKFLWRDAFFEDQSVVIGACGQEMASQYIINNHATFDTVVYCLEAMPSTAAQLLKTSKRLKLDGRFEVMNVAVSSKDGWALFPNQQDSLGVEHLGLEDCSESPQLCANVSMTTLDSLLLAENNGDDSTAMKIDFLSIDVEGHDFYALLGAKRLLTNVRYLEFEYHNKEPWGRHSLNSAIDYLDSFGFICYWAGRKGHVWRITNCLRDQYNEHFWSNIACVNGNDMFVRSLAERLEELFQATLHKGANLAKEIVEEG